MQPTHNKFSLSTNLRRRHAASYPDEAFHVSSAPRESLDQEAGETLGHQLQLNKNIVVLGKCTWAYTEGFVIAPLVGGE